jgi:hypothetical protein
MLEGPRTTTSHSWASAVAKAMVPCHCPLQIGPAAGPAAPCDRRSPGPPARAAACPADRPAPRPATFFQGADGRRIFREEIFGSVLAVMTFEGEAAALRIANDIP